MATMSSFASSNILRPNIPENESYGTMGLRQRHWNNSIGTRINDENLNPNSSTQSNLHSMPRAPPKASLSTAGKSAFQTSIFSSSDRPPASKTSHSEAPAILPSGANGETDHSLWVVAYGFRNEAQFRALMNLLESCGTVTARRGGLSALGERGQIDDDGKNWVAVRYNSELAAEKARSMNETFLDVGGSTIVIGVMPLARFNASTKHGIDFSSSSSLELETHAIVNRGGGVSSRQTTSESDILLIEDDQETLLDHSGIESACYKFLAWIFGWKQNSNN